MITGLEHGKLTQTIFEKWNISKNYLRYALPSLLVFNLKCLHFQALFEKHRLYLSMMLEHWRFSLRGYVNPKSHTSIRAQYPCISRYKVSTLYSGMTGWYLALWRIQCLNIKLFCAGAQLNSAQEPSVNTALGYPQSPQYTLFFYIRMLFSGPGWIFWFFCRF